MFTVKVSHGMIYSLAAFILSSIERHVFTTAADFSRLVHTFQSESLSCWYWASCDGDRCVKVNYVIQCFCLIFPSASSSPPPLHLLNCPQSRVRVVVFSVRFLPVVGQWGRGGWERMLNVCVLQCFIMLYCCQPCAWHFIDCIEWKCVCVCVCWDWRGLQGDEWVL